MDSFTQSAGNVGFNAVIGLCCGLHLISPAIIRAPFTSQGRSLHPQSPVSISGRLVVVQVEFVTMLVAQLGSDAFTAHPKADVLQLVIQWAGLAFLMLVTMLQSRNNRKAIDDDAGAAYNLILLLPAVHAMISMSGLQRALYIEDALPDRRSASLLAVFYTIHRFMAPVATVSLVASYLNQGVYMQRASEQGEHIDTGLEQMVLRYEALTHAVLASYWLWSIRLPWTWSWYLDGGWVCTNSVIRAMLSLVLTSCLPVVEQTELGSCKIEKIDQWSSKRERNPSDEKKASEDREYA